MSVLGKLQFNKLRNIKLSTFLQDLVFTGLTSILTTIAALITTRLLASGLGPTEYGAYALARRLSITIVPLISIGMSLALTYYLAQEKSERTQRVYIAIGALISFIFPLILLLIGWFNLDFFAGFFFQDVKYTSLVLSLFFVVAAYTNYRTVYAYFRGKFLMKYANYMQLVLLVAAPIFVAIAFRHYQRADIIMYGVGAFVYLSSIILAVLLWRSLSSLQNSAAVVAGGRKLVGYGTSRIPNSFFSAAIFAMGPFFAGYVGTLKEVGYLSASQAVLVALQGGLTSFGVLILPKVASLIGDGDQSKVAKIVESTLMFVIHIGLYAAIFCFVWTDLIISLLLGSEYADAAPFMRIILLSLLPYLAYVMLRSVVDAVDLRAINARNMFIAFATTAGLCSLFTFLGWDVTYIAISSMLGFMIMGGLTTFFLAQNYRIDWANGHLAKIIPFNILILAGITLSRLGLSKVDVPISEFILFVTTFCIFSLAYFIFLFKYVKPNWIDEISQRVR